MDERYWLLGTAFNTAIECVQFVFPSSFFSFPGAWFANSFAFFTFDLTGLYCKRKRVRMNVCCTWTIAIIVSQWVEAGRSEAMV
ncbi:hypothetical protein DFP72DRAFT_886597 [Ephemerocybe angulata]|uniref:Uncharacterized protein n=1 Tax=Ephemerocybe angulata TaxID=980116 RepID=A0A8H6I4W7_9AGAR|nr:hypothetical protein DFP72DRAFT_886597 [Tulosesus angulatus]